MDTARADRVPQVAKYEILEEIGRGGMATVYRALDPRLGREVALKVIHPHLRDSAEVALRFHTEAKAVAKLRHPNIVEVFDVSGSDERDQYLVVELVRGTTLRRLMQEHGPFPPEIAGALALPLLDALSHAHASGVIHRDIKPENVLVDQCTSAPAGASERRKRVTVKLTDFGIAKLLDAQGVTSTGQVLGSPAHMAPEQIEGGEVDARSDVFGLGVLFYDCIVGHLPFEGANPAQVLRGVLEGRYPPAQSEVPRVGSRWSEIVDRALAHSREARFPTAHALRDAVGAELDRLGFTEPERELEAWMGDPVAYGAAHASRVVARLCECADAARRRGDALGAAADYNRALANAPHDPHLLRIVARMNQAEARRRAFGRAALALAMAVGVCGAGGALSLVVRGGRGHPDRTPQSPSGFALSARIPEARRGDPAEPAKTAAPEAVAAAAVPHVREVVQRHVIGRQLTLDLTPPMGLTVTVDGEPSRSVTTGDALAVDSSAHSLVFDCPVCISVRLALAAGDRDDTLVVAVPVKPATLVIEGDADNSYQIIQHPELSVRPGTNTIPLKSAFERIAVRQIETGVSVAVRLEAGKTMRASFAP